MLLVFCIASLVSIVLLLTANDTVFAQEWSSSQKEVWKNVETYSKLIVEKDLEGLLSYFHPDFLGWVYGLDFPTDKASRSKSIAHIFQTTKVLVDELKPVGIKIHGNVAIVHYYLHEIVNDAEGKEIVQRHRWTDILLKQGDNWVLIGDHGGVISDD